MNISATVAAEVSGIATEMASLENRSDSTKIYTLPAFVRRKGPWISQAMSSLKRLDCAVIDAAGM
jgi:hypothetical protein